MDLPSKFSDSYILPTNLPIPPRIPAMYLETDVSIIPCCLVHLLFIKVRILTACCIKLAYFRTVYPGRYDRVFQIGRASCRVRVAISVGADALKDKKQIS